MVGRFGNHRRKSCVTEWCVVLLDETNKAMRVKQAMFGFTNMIVNYTRCKETTALCSSINVKISSNLSPWGWLEQHLRSCGIAAFFWTSPCKKIGGKPKDFKGMGVTFNMFLWVFLQSTSINHGYILRMAWDGPQSSHQYIICWFCWYMFVIYKGNQHAHSPLDIMGNMFLGHR